ncbi:nuclear transport factor 2 family protein [Salinibius halmophilus]|uniref:nuclear transport factor 2 family protein n=1 Tax=Salinibius halmophilus TaxID=1853216 RepID=UPI000E66DD6B|nr:nuclear transport factor 2 family protein [Salinibius halmophilus]
MRAVDKLQAVYKQLNRDTINTALLAQAYDANVVFEDPFHRVHGIEALTEDFRGLYKNVTSIDFDYRSSVEFDEHGYIEWDMTFVHPRIKGGQAVIVNGITKVKIANGLIIEHRDYFDGGQMLYENVPVIGAGVRWLKGRLA